jgi:TPR repeat protein
MAVERESVNAMFNLALFYYENDKNLELAEKYYLMAIEKGDTDAMSNLAYLYHSIGKNTDKIEEYLRLSHSSGNLRGTLNLVVFYSESARTEEMLQVSYEVMNREDLYKNEQVLFNLIYIIFMKKQYHFLLKMFKKNEFYLMKHARPFYYVLAWFMRDELPGEYEKVGSEIKETVDEIITLIEKEYDKSEVLETEMEK